jgi:hypothetical protein
LVGALNRRAAELTALRVPQGGLVGPGRFVVSGVGLCLPYPPRKTPRLSTPRRAVSTRCTG